MRGPSDFYDNERKDCKEWNRCDKNGKNCKNPNHLERFGSGTHIQIINRHLKSLIDFNKNSGKQHNHH